MTKKLTDDAELRAVSRTPFINTVNRPGSLMYWNAMYEQ